MSNTSLVVKQYGSADAFAKDARKMAKHGYRVAQQSSVQKRGLISFLLFFWPRKSLTVVTYELKELPAPLVVAQ
jgi:hypothetical protein